MASLFDKAKAKEVKKEIKTKDLKTRIEVSDSDFFDKVKKYEELNTIVKSSKAKADIISDDLRNIARSNWTELYEKNEENPGTVVLEQTVDDDIAQVMFVPTDKYITVNEERAEELREEYGNHIIEEKTTFTFSDEMVEKYGELLSYMIENSDDIDENDKHKIIKSITTYSISKGTINRLKDYGKVNEMMNSVKPIVQLKSIEIIKG